MPRNDRWGSKQVYRMITPEMRAEAARIEAERREAEQGRVTLLGAHLRGTRLVINDTDLQCTHNLPWRSCTTCSKPRTP